MSDLIDRQQAKDAIDKYLVGRNLATDGTFMARLINEIVIDRLPSAQPTFDARDTQYNLPIGTDCISRQQAIEALEKCYTCKHVYQRVSDADTLYCRCRKGCRYEEFKPKRSGESPRRHEE